MTIFLICTDTFCCFQHSSTGATADSGGKQKIMFSVWKRQIPVCGFIFDVVLFVKNREM